jgi:hypothetical protein
MNGIAIKEIETENIDLEELSNSLYISVKKLEKTTDELYTSVKGLQGAVADMNKTLDRLNDNTNKRFDKVDSKLDKIIHFFGGGHNGK